MILRSENEIKFASKRRKKHIFMPPWIQLSQVQFLMFQRLKLKRRYQISIKKWSSLGNKKQERLKNVTITKKTRKLCMKYWRICIRKIHSKCSWKYSKTPCIKPTISMIIQTIRRMMHAICWGKKTAGKISTPLSKRRTLTRWWMLPISGQIIAAREPKLIKRF